MGAVAKLLGNKDGVLSGVINLESSDVSASGWRLRHNEHYDEASSAQPAAEAGVGLFDSWFDPLEAELRLRSFIEELIRGELDAGVMGEAG